LQWLHYIPRNKSKLQFRWYTKSSWWPLRH